VPWGLGRRRAGEIALPELNHGFGDCQIGGRGERLAHRFNLPGRVGFGTELPPLSQTWVRHWVRGKTSRQKRVSSQRVRISVRCLSCHQLSIGLAGCRGFARFQQYSSQTFSAHLWWRGDKKETKILSLRRSARKLARPERFERPTPRFVVWCSIQLSYGRVAGRDLTAIRAGRPHSYRLAVPLARPIRL
jgi:hypothetical protein